MKISTEGIDGFDGMTDAQKVEALLSHEFPDQQDAEQTTAPDMSQYVSKVKFDALESRNKDLSRQLKARQTEEERQAAEKQAEHEQLLQERDEWKKKSVVAEYTSRFLAMPGYDEKLARATAEAMYAGDSEKVFSYQQQASENHAKTLKAELMKSSPEPQGVTGGQSASAAEEQAKKIGQAQAYSAKAANDVLKHYL